MNTPAVANTVAPSNPPPHAEEGREIGLHRRGWALAVAIGCLVFLVGCSNSGNQQNNASGGAQRSSPHGEGQARQSPDEFVASATVVIDKLEAGLGDIADGRATDLPAGLGSMTDIVMGSSMRAADPLASGGTVGDWYESRLGRLADLQRLGIERLASSLVAGESVMDSLRALSSRHSPPLPNLRDEVSLREKRIEVDRAKLAVGWLRIADWSVPQDYREDLRAHLRSQWPASYHLQPVFGHALGAIEERATWGVLEPNFNIESQMYEGAAKSGFAKPTASLNSALKVEWEFVAPRNIRTSWTNLPSIDIQLDPPASFYEDEADALQERFDIELKQRFRDALESLVPTFEIVSPDVHQFLDWNHQLPPAGFGPDELIAVAAMNRSVALDLAEAIRFPSKSGSALTRATTRDEEEGRDQPDFSQAELDEAAVRAGLDEMASGIGPRLRMMERAEARELMRALEERPWFGDYQPLLGVAQRTDLPHRRDAISAMMRASADPAVYQLLRPLLDDPDDPLRAELVEMLVRIAPRDSLHDLADLFPKPMPGLVDGVEAEKRDQFAINLIIRLRDRDPDLADEIAAAHFADTTPRVQEWMMRGFEYDPEKHGESQLALLESAARSDNPNVARAARGRLMTYAWSEPVWRALWLVSSGGSGLDEREAMTIRERLLLNVDRAVPDEAEAYQRAELERVHQMLGLQIEDESTRRALESLRRTAINEYLSADGDRSARTAELWRLVQSRPTDTSMLAATMQNVRQFQFRGGWDYAQPELRSLVEAGLESSDSRIQQDARQIVEHGAKARDVWFAERHQE